MTRLMLGNNMESLKKLEPNSIDAVVTDAPYGLSFMQKIWDYDVPSVDFWKEVFRVLKPGGHVLSFGGTRTYHRMTVNIEDAGFEIRDQIQWIYGAGFPKSHNIGKSVDKIRGTEGTSEWQGWGSALKPASEPICVARKPLSEKTIVGNVLRWGTGGINIDGCRIKYVDGSHPKDLYGDAYMKSGYGKVNGDLQSISGNKREGVYVNDEGRFPANIIFDKEAGKILDQQSGISKSNCKSGIVEGKDANVFNDGETKKTGHKEKIMVGDYNDKGGASRFFYCAKVSKKERNLGLEEFEDAERHFNLSKTVSNSKLPTKNSHPTVKPINLMAYLCRLITPPNGTVLDPFMGSGSTGIAAQLEGFNFVGMEMDQDYFKVAETRVKSYEKYRELKK